MSYRLALFDFDGVLADSAGWFIGHLPDLARRHGFRAPDAAEIERHRHLPTRDIVKSLRVSPLRLPAIATDLRHRMAAEAGNIRLFEGVPEMMHMLHDGGVRIAIVSSNSEANVRTVLGDCGALVSAFSCGTSLFGKASRFTRLIQRFDLDPRQACVIGDEVRDIEAAHEARIAAIAVSWGYAAAEALAAAVPDHLARQPSEVATLLLKSSKGS